MFWNLRNSSLMGTKLGKQEHFEDAIITIEDNTLQLKKRIGYGGSSIVYRGIYNTSECAVKIRKIRSIFSVVSSKQTNEEEENITLQNFDPPTIRSEYIKNEITRLKSLNKSSFVINLIENIKFGNESWMITEFCSFELTKVLKNVPDNLHEILFFHLITPLVYTLRTMHNMNFVHRDIKPANFLITRNGIPKICDFELATNLNPNTYFYDSMTCLKGGSPYFVAPEHLRREFCSEKVDSFSFGLTCLCLFRHDENPSRFFDDMTFSDLVNCYDPMWKRKEWLFFEETLEVKKILKKNLNEILVKNVEFSIWNIYVQDYISKLIEFDVQERLSLDELCTTFDVFQTIQKDWKALLTQSEIKASENFLEVHSKLLSLLESL